MTAPSTALGWQDFTRDELFALVQEIVDRNLLSGFEESCLRARHTAARARERAAGDRESAALKAMSEAHDAWHKRPGDKRYLAYAEARVTYERNRKAYDAWARRVQLRWDALMDFWARERA